MKKTFLFLIVLVFFQTASNAQQCWCAFFTSGPTVTYNGTTKANTITWTTDTESAEAYDFVVERSTTTGGGTYSVIGSVSANPSASAHSYSFVDPYPCGSSGNVYYRLKSVNINGSMRYSNILVGTSECSGSCSSNPTACACNLSSLTGPSTICSTDGTYEVVHASGPVTWSFSNPSVANVTYLSSTKIKLSKVADGVNTITAAVSGCSNLNKTVVFGTPTPAGISGPNHDLCYDGRTSEIGQFSVYGGSSALTYYWQIDGMGAGIGTTINVNAFHWDIGNHQIRVRSYTAACGYSAWYTSSFIIVDCSSFRTKLSLSPNPAVNHVNVSLPPAAENNKSKVLSIVEVEIANNMGTVVFKQKYGKGSSSIRIPTHQLKDDIYTIRVFDGEKWITDKLVVKH